MKFSVFFGFSGCKAWPAEPLSPHTFPHLSELQSTGKASPALHCGMLSTLGGTQAGYKGEQIQEVLLSPDKSGRKRMLPSNELGIGTCCAPIAELNPWQWLTPTGSGPGGGPVAPQPVI